MFVELIKKQYREAKTIFNINIDLRINALSVQLILVSWLFLTFS
jgi:hypothetical protein